MGQRYIWLAGLLVLALAGCSEKKKPQAAASIRPTPPPMAEAEPEEMAEAIVEDYRYRPDGKRDPFESFVRVRLSSEDSDIASPLERYDLSQLMVTGIVWGTTNARALIEDPSGKGYIVGVGTAIGKNRGKVITIGNNRVVVKETYVDFHDRASTKEVEMLLYETQGG